MEENKLFYARQRERHRSGLQRLKRRLALLAGLRLVVFLATLLGGYFLWDHSAVYVILPMGILVFLYLVLNNIELKRQKGHLQRLIAINETELEVASRNFHHLPDGARFMDPEHPYAHDLDLFGRGSFFQYCNRTALKQGKEVLAGLFLDDHPKDIPQKQAAVRELADRPEWRQRFWAMAGGTRPEHTHDKVTHWLRGHRSFVPSRARYVAPAFAGISILLILAAFMEWVPWGLVVLWYVLGNVIVGRYFKRIMDFSSKISKVQDTIDQYQRLILEVEQQNFGSRLLREMQGRLHREDEPTSKILKRFHRSLAMLDQQNNMVILMLGQGLALWSLYFAHRVEQWVLEYGGDVEAWFDAIAHFDAYCCLGNYAFNHPDHSYPEIVPAGPVLHARDLGHPLIDPQRNVLNDIALDRGRFCIVTGANMAGKSTFLRSVALQLVMANTGLPVKGKEVRYSPLRLLTSMRSSDSLTEGTSYFHAELKRLKFIVDELDKGDCFVVLDEILKGTNSVDKATGSKKFVERLVRARATGLVATHDLSLCELADGMPQVENRYFDARIVDGELYFDYRFKEGICQNMNASFLLKKMGIVD